MDHIMVAVAIGMGLAFTTGVILGVVAMITAALRREDRRNTLTRQPPHAAARGVVPGPSLRVPEISMKIATSSVRAAEDGKVAA